MMKSKTIVTLAFAGILIANIFSACRSPAGNESAQAKSSSVSIDSTVKQATEQNNAGVQAPQFSTENIEVKTFEVKDDTGKAKGWGYDLYVNGKKTIHQPTIPAVAGNDSFKTQVQAEAVGKLAANKMIVTGSLPTISVEELISLGVIKK